MTTRRLESPRSRHQRTSGLFEKGNPNNIYDLLECLGEGTYGTVWTATKKEVEGTCAVKIVTIDDDLDDIKREIAIMKYSDSPFIVRFLGNLLIFLILLNV